MSCDVYYVFYDTSYMNILSKYRSKIYCDIVGAGSPLGCAGNIAINFVAIFFNIVTKFWGFLIFCCDITQYCNKISEFFEFFGIFRKFFAILGNIATKSKKAQKFRNDIGLYPWMKILLRLGRNSKISMETTPINQTLLWEKLLL